jgi:hypothetical protein
VPFSENDRSRYARSYTGRFSRFLMRLNSIDVLYALLIAAVLLLFVVAAP